MMLAIIMLLAYYNYYIIYCVGIRRRRGRQRRNAQMHASYIAIPYFFCDHTHQNLIESFLQAFLPLTSSSSLYTLMIR